VSLLSWFKRAPTAEPRLEVEPVSPEQRDTIDAIVSIFETGRLPSAAAYATTTILSDGAGISYGSHQATARGGALQAVIEDYYTRGGVLQVRDEPAPLRVVLETATRSVGLTPGGVPLDVMALMRALERAGSEPVMREAQRHVFDRRYWAPTYATGRELGLKYALSYLALYDLSIHSGPPSSASDSTSRLAKLRRDFSAYPPSDPRTRGERVWVVALIQARRRWLAAHSNPVVQKTVYRCDSLLDLAEAGAWDLRRPLTVRGVRIP